MQKIILFGQMQQAEPFMDPQLMAYLQQGRTETFEAFADFYLLAFDWYNVSGPDKETAKILMYLDREDLFFFCENDRALQMVQANVPPDRSNENALYQFFIALLREDMDNLNTYETEITDAETIALTRAARCDYIEKIVAYRKELLRRKRYYEQLIAIFENLKADDESLLTRDCERHFSILQNRVERFCGTVLNLHDYVTQMREAYQAQIDIEQNQLMKLFTVITALFLPLTLLVGWYGMNFEAMPELHWKYGYAAVIGVSIALSGGLILWFKKKHWF